MTSEGTLPLVSILVISHNYGRFLAEAIESALAQTYEPTEIILVDDGSTDGSLDVARRYESSIRILSHPNVGVEQTCNRAVQEATAGYFVFLSADDVFEPSYVEELYRALRRSPEASYAYCRAQRFGAETGLMKGFLFSPYILVRRGNYVNASALIAKEDYLAAGGFDEDLADYALEDWDFWLRCSSAGSAEPTYALHSSAGGATPREAGTPSRRRSWHAPQRSSVTATERSTSERRTGEGASVTRSS